MKVLFLDVDGVLNRNGTKERVNGFVGLDAVLVKRLVDWLVLRSDVHIVLSSTWRLESAFTDALKAELNTQGIFWQNQTPSIPSLGRGMEINAWLMEHLDVTHFAILDDIGQMNPLQHALVQTSESKGLEEKHLRKLDKLLGYD